MGSDAQRIADLTPYLHALWFAPLQVPEQACASESSVSNVNSPHD